MDKLVVTPEEAARMLATSPNTVYELLKDGRLPAFTIGSNWKIPVESLKKYVIDRAENESARRRLNK